MSWHKKSRTIHKWLMLFVGIQFLIWSISGVYMVVMDIHYIHGDSLIKQPNKEQSTKVSNTQNSILTNTQRNPQNNIQGNRALPSLNSLHSSQLTFSIKQLMKHYPHAEQIELSRLLSQAVYRFKLDGQYYVVDANNGDLLSPISKSIAIKIARQQYNGDISSSDFHVSYLSDEAPRELSSRHLPVWRIDIDDFASPTFYVSADSGQVVTKRHSYWRIFDWMFAFHVMDYIEESADNTLLLIVSVIASLASFFGLVLIYFRVFSQGKPRNVAVNNS